MQAGVTSPARPWFYLGVSDSVLAKSYAVKSWLHLVTEKMQEVFLKSNLYNTTPILYADMSVFATACVLIEEDFDDVIRFYSFPVGSYYISNDDKLQVCTFMREFRMTVRQLIQRFGRDYDGGNIDWSRFSDTVKSLYDDGNYESRIDVTHAIIPNEDYDPRMAESKYKKYYSCYYESGNNKDVYLRESGYDYFPVLCSRWEVTGEDVYGTNSPGMTALGDIKQLQTMEKRCLQAIEKQVNPPMQGPTSLRSAKASILPGDITLYDMRDGMQGFRPVHDVQARIGDIEGKCEQVRQRIRRVFFEDLFLMLSMTDRREITAREIDERHEEKMFVLGSVLERLNQDFLEPLIDITFTMMLRQGLIPEPPPELQGQPLKVEYVSVMAQAQKLNSIGGIERLSQFTMNWAALDPTILDKVNRDALVEEYGDVVGVSPDVMVPDIQVQQIRAARQQAQAAQMQAQNIRDASAGVKNLAKADLSGDNALSRLLKVSEAGNNLPPE